jgi:hypothetical protein
MSNDDPTLKKLNAGYRVFIVKNNVILYIPIKLQYLSLRLDDFLITT